ncbi:sensor domain-containing diguanylate cyclase [Ectorhizobium quercum]|nr:sensor domain-containing diguanylate cyclase [Ectorhizobium quercum]
MLLGVFVAYGAGAAAGFLMLERGMREQWRNQAEMNAQIVSSVIRGIYTALVVEADAEGQVVRIVSELPIGDETSILSTGFNPVDVLALAAAQTRNEVWLFQKNEDGSGFVSTAGSGDNHAGVLITFDDSDAPSPDRASFFVGFATVDGVQHLVSALPVVASRGEVHGLVVSSIGQSAALFETRNALVKQSLLVLIAVLVVTTAIVAFLMRRLFRPVPVLIQALTRIANNDTGVATPFRGRNDEIGYLADAIETLREAVVEREHLREVREATLQFEHMAHHDSLTGLPNRAYLNKALAKATDSLSDGQRVNFLMLDLDLFKPVNDTHGHAVGDTLLVAVANRLSLLLGADDIAARLGGDEFAILQHVSHDSEKEGRRLAERIVETLGRPFVVDGLQLSIGGSVGIACAPEAGRDAHELFTRADAALYASKRQGRRTYAFYSDTLLEDEGKYRALGA